VDRYVLLWDVFLRGFGLRVTAAGVRSFVVERRVGGRTRRLTLGQWPSISVAVAQNRARIYLAQISAGQDPIRRRSARLLRINVEHAFYAYIRGKRRFKDGLPLTERTQRDVLSVLRRYFGDWRDRSLSSITRPMVQSRYRELCEHTVSQANVSMRYLRAVFNFIAHDVRDAGQRPIRVDNPVNVLRHQWQTLERRSRVMSAEQMRRWLPAVQSLGAPEAASLPDGGRLQPLRDGEVYRDLFLFMALTGCRTSEALRLKRSSIDWAAGTLRILKTKNCRDHTLPLTNTLREIVSRRAGSSSNGRVFSSLRAGKSLGNFRRALARVRTVSGVNDFCPQGFAAWAATAMEQAGVGVYTMKGVLNHLSGRRVVIGTRSGEGVENPVVEGEIHAANRDVTGGYVQINLEMKRWALEKIEPYLWGVKDVRLAESDVPRQPEPRGSVIRIHLTKRDGKIEQVTEIVMAESRGAYIVPTPEAAAEAA
jgi:integrase